jgi:Predicted Zn-dependent peptidases
MIKKRKGWVIMSVIKKKIADGIYLNFIETDKFKTNYLSVNFITKLNKETASLNALIPMVLKRGTVKYPTMAEINEELENLYATGIYSRVYKRGENQIVGFTSYMLDNSYTIDDTDILASTIDMFDQLIFCPKTENGVFIESYVDGEKSNLIDNINALINNKNRYAVWRCQEEMCKDEVFGIPESGTVEDVEKITPQSLYTQYKNILNESQIQVYYVGQCDIDWLSDKLTELFKNINHTDVKLETAVIRKAETIKEITEDQPVTQGKLSLGFRTGSILNDGDYHKFILFNEIFGGSPTCKLFMNVREKLSLCYYCHSIAESLKGIMVVASGIEVANKELAQSEILLQLDNIKNGIMTDEEITSAKNSIVNGYRTINDSSSDLEAWYMNRMLAGLTSSPEEAIDLINSVTKDDIIEVANKITLDTIYFLNGTLTGGDEDNEDE